MTEPVQPTDAELAELGLYNPDDPEASDMLWLIRHWLSLGGTVDEMLASTPREVVLKLQLRPGQRYTLLEVSERAGITVEQARLIERASGFADPGDGDSLQPPTRPPPSRCWT
jgi:hypothetical protein